LSLTISSDGLLSGARGAVKLSRRSQNPNGDEAGDGKADVNPGMGLLSIR